MHRKTAESLVSSSQKPLGPGLFQAKQNKSAASFGAARAQVACERWNSCPAPSLHPWWPSRISTSGTARQITTDTVLRLARWSLSFRAVQLGLQPSDFVQQPREFFAEFSQPILDSRRNFRELYTLKYSRARKMPEIRRSRRKTMRRDPASGREIRNSRRPRT